MKIAFVGQPIDVYIPPVQAGSIPIWNYQVARRIVPQHQVTIYARRAGDQLPTEASEGIAYRRVAIGSDEKFARGLRFLERLLNYPQPRRPSYASQHYFSTYIRHIARALQQTQPAIVHLFNFSQFVPVLRAANPKSKIVLHMHCEWLSQLDHATVDKRLQQVDLVIGCSDYVTQKIRERYPHHAERCHTVYNGVDLTHFLATPSEAANSTHRSMYRSTVPAAAGRQEDKPKRLLFVGRISPEKGVHVLVQAMHQVVAQMPNVHLDIVGTPGDLPYEYIVLLGQHETVTDLAAFYPGVLRRGNYYEAVQRMAEPLAQHITFAGSVPHERVVDFYHNTDLLVNPSLSESFGMSLIEAMASNVPVVVSQVGGMTDIVRHEDNGLFVEPGNTEQLARAILDVLQNDQKRDRLTQSGRASLTDRFSWDAVANRLLTLYDAVL